jgi:hypothetical protein
VFTKIAIALDNSFAESKPIERPLEAVQIS